MKNPPPRTPTTATRATLPAARVILVLLRHGDAGDTRALPERDALRPLTPKGRKQAKRAGKALVRMGLSPRDVWTSRLRRAIETAREALAPTGASPRVTMTAALSPEATPDRIVRALVETPPPPVSLDTASARKLQTRRSVGRKSRAPSEPASIVRWVVGHDPHLVRLAAFATGAPEASIRLPKGAFAVIAFDARGPAAGTAVLTGLLDPDALKAVARHRRA